MQAALQKHVDNAISKTISVPVKFEYERFSKLFETAYGLGLKGGTTFRPNAVTASNSCRKMTWILAAGCRWLEASPGTSWPLEGSAHQLRLRERL